MERELEILEGVRVFTLGSSNSQRLILFIDRYNLYTKSADIHRLVGSFVDQDTFVVFFDHSSITPACRIAVDPMTCPHGTPDNLVHQVSVLKQWLKNISFKEIILLSQSAGGIVSALLCHDSRVRKMVCFGYPFKNPENEEEYYRIESLHRVNCSFLIIQGSKDAYGGKDVLGKYILPPNIMMSFYDTTHGFDDLSPECLNAMENEVVQFVEGGDASSSYISDIPLNSFQYTYSKYIYQSKMNTQLMTTNALLASEVDRLRTEVRSLIDGNRYLLEEVRSLIDGIIDGNRDFREEVRSLIDGNRDLRAEVRKTEDKIGDLLGAPSVFRKMALDSGMPFMRKMAERREVERLIDLKFDENFYLETHADVKANGISPVLHYVRHGRRERRALRFAANDC